MFTTVHHSLTDVKTGSNREISKILIIDDDETIRRLVVGALSKQGFATFAAPDGAAGIAMASETPPDLIICDLAMPGMDGYEVLAALRRDAKLADTAVIFLSGQAEPDQVRQGMNLGADDYLPKPVDLADLLGAIKARLKRRQVEHQRQQKQIERAMQVYAEVVHDMRDPLFVILGCADLLHSAPSQPLPDADRSRVLLDRMQQAVLRMQGIISETLFLAKSRMHRLPFDPGPLDLKGFCEQIVANHEQRPRLRFQCGAEPCPIVADALRLHQAMDNLLSNALKYSEQPVEITLLSTATAYQIAIADRGIGIPPAEQGPIFEPFFRASNAAGKPGHGLGLSIVKSCIEQHGGTIRFTSDLQKGTTFVISLCKTPAGLAAYKAAAPADTQPVANRSPRPQALEAVAAPSAPGLARPPQSSLSARPAQSRLRGIIVDDDSLVRSVLRDLLESSNEVVIRGEAGTVAQARQLARQHRPEVVFLDVNLPDGSGFELLPHLEANTSVVFVASAEEYAVHAFDCEAADYLLKPVSSERLQRALQRVRQRLASRSMDVAPTSTPRSGSFLVKTLTEKRLVEFNEVRSIVAYGEYSWVYWDKDKGALLRKPLKQWEAELPGDQFIRVHRQAIVNLAYLERIEKLPGGKMQVHLQNSQKSFPVSLRLGPMLNRKLKAFCR